MKFADVSKENLTGIYIPSELAANTTLSWNEKAVYSIYHYFTYYGQSHCCRLTNDTICERLGIKERSLQRIKNDLTNNGYITVNGITVKALKEFAGVTEMTPIANDEQRGDTFDTHSEQNTGVTLLTPIAVEQPRVTNMVEGVTKMVARGDTFDTHNKENKELNKAIIITSDSLCNDTLSKQDVIVNKRDSHQSEPDPVNNKITSDLDLYVDSNTPDIPEWMNELKPVEPWEQYTDDIQGEAMEKTTNEPLQADEKLNDPDPVTDNVNITSSDVIYRENALNGLGEALGVSPADIYDEETENEPLQDEETDPDEAQENETSKLSDLSNERDDGGTTTHRQGESLPNGEKTTSTGTTNPETDNVNNNLNKDIQNMNVQERKAKQTELSRKWENFKLQVPQMHRADAETYFKRFLNKVSEYYTGTHINTTQERYMREFKQLKPLADWNEDEAKQDIENWISQGFNTETIKRYVKQKYGEEHDEFVMQKRREHYSRPIEVTPEYAEWLKNPVGPAPLPF